MIRFQTAGGVIPHETRFAPIQSPPSANVGRCRRWNVKVGFSYSLSERRYVFDMTYLFAFYRTVLESDRTADTEVSPARTGLLWIRCRLLRTRGNAM